MSLSVRIEQYASTHWHSQNLWLRLHCQCQCSFS